MPRRPLDGLDAVIFDLDGVITDTASVHAEAWRRTFDAFLADRRDLAPEDARPFTDDDYRLHVDGKPRVAGVEDFLASRGIELPHGEPHDSPTRETAWGVGNRKNQEFQRVLEQEGVQPFPDAVALVEALRGEGTGVAVISASRNCEAVLRAAGVRSLFEVKVDGLDAEQLGLAGKPDPAVFAEAARRLGVTPRAAAVIEDALAGVEAGRRGDFGLVVGVARDRAGDELEGAGADLVVSDLTELLGDPARRGRGDDG